MADTRKEAPSREEIAKLPRWAKVAFAARCARRVQPLFKVFRPEVPTKPCEAIETAIRLAESAAGNATSPLAVDGAHAAANADAHSHADAYADAAHVAANAAHADADANAAHAAAHAAHAAHDADAAVVYAAQAEADEDDDAAHSAARNAGAADDDAATHAADAAANAAHAAARRGIPSRDSTVRAMWVDFEKLKATAKEEHWIDGTPVPREFFGTLWPEGEPPGWASAATEPARQKKAQTASKEERLVVQASVRVPVDDEMLVDGITELYQALNRYHILCGGTGLTIDDWQIFVPSGTRVGELV